VYIVPQPPKPEKKHAAEHTANNRGLVFGL